MAFNGIFKLYKKKTTFVNDSRKWFLENASQQINHAMLFYAHALSSNAYVPARFLVLPPPIHHR